MATALTADQLAQAKVQIAASKVAAVQMVITDLNTTTTTLATLKADIATALSTLDPTDSARQQIANLGSVLNQGVGNLTTQLTQLQAMAAAATS